MNGLLDINTPNGQKTLPQVDRAYEIFEQRFPGFMVISTIEDRAADNDSFVCQVVGKRPVVRAVVEVKCRNETLRKMHGTGEHDYHSEWLITLDKLKRCGAIAASLKVPFIGLCYLVPDDILLVQRIYNWDGSKATDIRDEWGVTDATCNGGKANRLNAYVKVHDKGDWKPTQVWALNDPVLPTTPYEPEDDPFYDPRFKPRR